MLVIAIDPNETRYLVILYYLPDLDFVGNLEKA